jgi:serine/threonine protein kinase
MPLVAVTRLGPYEILAPLGAGGMGEVCRARDTRLGREVAIKVLPQDYASSPQVRTRFEREARTILQLNHPNLCTLHNVGHQDGVNYLMMELVAGETLARHTRDFPDRAPRQPGYINHLWGAVAKASRAHEAPGVKVLRGGAP